MLFLTNEQRKCFALTECYANWRIVKLDRSRYDHEDTYVYITEEHEVKKVILIGEKFYHEYDVLEKLSEDEKYLLPKTERGKAVKFTAATITKRAQLNMGLTYCDHYVCITNYNAECDYYSSLYSGEKINNMEAFSAWIEKWCRETGEAELRDIETFAHRKKQHIEYKEGDFFRFRLDRKHFGYGRIILNYYEYSKMTEKCLLFMGRPLVAIVYRIATEDKNVSVEELDSLEMLPAQMIMDNIFYYGEAEIIGNRSVSHKKVEYPIHYGRPISAGSQGIFYQCGKTFIELPTEKLLFEDGYANRGISLLLHVNLPMLLECIRKNSNQPYWDKWENSKVRDLRNPKYYKELQQVKKQFGVLK